MKKILFVLILFIFAQALYGQVGEVNKVGTTAANFLKLEVGARAVSLAGGFTAVANDASALHWNPAGIAFFDKITATYNNTNLYAGIKHQFFGTIIPIGTNNFIGVSFNYVDIGKIQRTTEFNPEGVNLPMFDNYNMAVGFSYARQLTDRITFGTTVRWVNEQIWEEKANGFCGDVGIIFIPGLSGLRLGMSITNFGPNMAMDEGPLRTFSYEPREEQPGVGNRNLDAELQVEDYPMPVSFQIGAAFDLLGAQSVVMQNVSNRITAIMEVNDAFDNSMRAKYALEYEWRKLLSFPAGYKQNYDLAQFSWGGGLKIPIRGMDLRFDYAMANYGDLGDIHVTSIQIGF